ncbi:MAG: hypothetical protein ACFCU1_01285 [Sumerlaeia bacterium]
MAKTLYDKLARITVIREYSVLWQQYFAFFTEDFTERQFTAEEEQEFSTIVSYLALNQYKFAELSKGYFKDADGVLEVLADSVSLSQLQIMPEASLDKLQIDWHTHFISMNKAIGKMIKELSPKELEKLQEMQQSE